MRRAFLALAIGGAVAALAVTAPTPERHPRAPRTTHDMLRVFVDENAAAGFDFVYSSSRNAPTLADSLAVFKAAARPGDALPPLTRRAFAISGSEITPQPDRSRLLVASGSVRVFGFPTKQGAVCLVLDPYGGGSCAPGLLHGALPQVSRGQVWGLMDNGATAVDVRLPVSGWAHAVIGRNAFYLHLPRHVRAPTEIVVREQGGVRHVYEIERCRLSNLGPLAGSNPLGPPPC